MANLTALDRLWITAGNEVFRERPKTIVAVEYMRVLSRQEVEKICGDGIDVQQYLTSLLQTIERQRREIARFHKDLAEETRAVADERSWQHRQGEDYGSY